MDHVIVTIHWKICVLITSYYYTQSQFGNNAMHGQTVHEFNYVSFENVMPGPFNGDYSSENMYLNHFVLLHTVTSWQ
jgi:hypothetical protein